jgi:hypothetical protein
VGIVAKEPIRRKPRRSPKLPFLSIPFRVDIDDETWGAAMTWVVRMLRMMAMLLVSLLGFDGCAWVSHRLIAPPGLSFPGRMRDMQQCHFEAIRAVKSGEPPLRPHQIAPLKGRATQRFLQGDAPVVDQSGNPSPWRSPLAFYGDAEVSDRYVLCLLQSGYQWEDAATE